MENCVAHFESPTWLNTSLNSFAAPRLAAWQCLHQLIPSSCLLSVVMKILFRQSHRLLEFDSSFASLSVVTNHQCSIFLRHPNKVVQTCSKRCVWCTLFDLMLKGNGLIWLKVKVVFMMIKIFDDPKFDGTT